MAIITCDICDKSNVPGSHHEGTYAGDVSQCYVCAGDEFDPYDELWSHHWPAELPAEVIATCVGGRITSEMIVHSYSLLRAAMDLHRLAPIRIPTTAEILGQFDATIDAIKKA